jgi:hypothetical protein
LRARAERFALNEHAATYRQRKLNELPIRWQRALNDQWNAVAV